MGTRERWSLCGAKMPSFEGVAWDEPSVVLPASHDSPDGYKLSLTSWEAVKKAAEEAIADYQALYEKDEL